MMTSEETRILAFLRTHGATTVGALARMCLPGLPADWISRVVANLDWLGYVTIYGEGGSHVLLQITERGRAVAT